MSKVLLTHDLKKRRKIIERLFLELSVCENSAAVDTLHTFCDAASEPACVITQSTWPVQEDRSGARRMAQ